jgi:hypothetical protein
MGKPNMEHKGETFDFGYTHYEIIPVVGEHGFEVRVLRNGKPVPWKYSVDFEIAADFHKYVGEDAVVALVKLAKADILEKRFDALLASMKKQ